METLMFFRKFKKTIQNILIVEDEPLVAFDNEMHLAEAGYRVVATVDNATDALAWLDKEEVQLVLADINLRGVRGGVDVAKVAHERSIAVLFATGACPENARDLAAGTLNKPYSAKDLVMAVQSVDLIICGKKPKSMPRALTLFHPTES